MSGLGTIHFLLVGIWLGLVLSEIVIELWGRKKDGTTVARLHYWIDLYLEIPILIGVLATGFALIIRIGGPLSLLLKAKIVTALIAIAANLYCAGLVIIRFRNIADAEKLQRLNGQIYRTTIGIPFGLAALLLAFRYRGIL